jgi:DNA (cytosine-5)-methyltransferase 1
MTYKVLSLFSGIGGADTGFGGDVVVHKQSVGAGCGEEYPGFNEFVKLPRLPFQVVFQNDILPGAEKVCKLNGVDHGYVTRSIYDLLAENHQFPQADVVVGGFPCQDFSHCGKRRGFESTKSHDLKSEVVEGGDNSRGTLYQCFVEVVKRVKPKMFVAENVHGLLTMKSEPIKEIVADFAALGYNVQYELVDCTHFGIPQTRKRVIIMGINTPDLPEGWNRLTWNRGTTCHVGNYFRHLLEPWDETDDVSQKAYSKAKRLGKGQGQKAVDMDGFGPTMRAEHHGNIEFRRHGEGERRLTVREAGLIQTFAPDYRFSEKVSMTGYKFIGNAVPPLLGYAVAHRVREILAI